jgi:hypothetical protein
MQTTGYFKSKRWIFSIILLWFFWALLLIGFQNLVTARLQLQRPDHVIGWTPSETEATSQNDKVYLVEPFLNQLVSWDSEYYLSIALGGYDDPAIMVGPRHGVYPSPNYAFFPMYPMVMRVMYQPLKLLHLKPIASVTLAGVIVSLLGTLLAMVSLYSLALPTLGDEGAWRVVFYFLIFPSSFFLAQVYTEGLFTGLAFSALALIQYSRKYKWALWVAAILAAMATLTRAVGISLIAAIALQVVINELELRQVSFLQWLKELPSRFPWQALLTGVGTILIPIGTYLLWSSSIYGKRFRLAEVPFGRGTLVFKETIKNSVSIFNALRGIGEAWQISNPTQSALYYSLEFLAVLIALIGIFACVRKYPGIAIFSFCAWIIPVFSGSPQSLIRYMLVLPTTFLFLGKLGSNRVFDRVWTIASLLLMGLLALLFSFDFWVA